MSRQTWNTSLSTDTPGNTHTFRDRSACRISQESGQEYPITGKKNIQNLAQLGRMKELQLGRMKELGVGNSSVSRTGPALGGWGS